MTKTLPGNEAPQPGISTAGGYPYNGNPYSDFLTHGSGQRLQTAAVETRAIRAMHPDRAVTIVSALGGAFFGPGGCDLMRFAEAGFAKATLSPQTSPNIIERWFQTPARRTTEDGGAFANTTVFAAYDYEYEGKTCLVYIAKGVDGYRELVYYWILGPPGSKHLELEGGDKDADTLIEAATRWQILTHEEVLVFDRGFWFTDKNLYKSIENSKWEDVILDQGKKDALIDDIESFFSGEKSYEEFSVPWKRGLIFYGPPGNGKTISIKAIMHMLTQRKNPTVELLYVKSLTSFQGPEFSINAIFDKARMMAPCLLIFEDIDSLVTPMVRSYFLNAVDGLESNHGILMIGSTNHLERLDPGIAKRPSRFDRKILFDLPVQKERVQYCQYWRHKLKDNKKIVFPEPLCEMIADITDEFSFAYMKEAFIATLMALRAHEKEGDEEDVGSVRGGGNGKGEAEKTPLWKEMQKQVKILREEMENDSITRQRRDVAVDTARGMAGLTIVGGLTVMGSQQEPRGQ